MPIDSNIFIHPLDKTAQKAHLKLVDEQKFHQTGL